MGTPTFQPPAMPPFIPINLGMAGKQAYKDDARYYGRSDVDFKKRHPEVVGAEDLFQKGLLKDWEGESTLMPQIQTEFMNAGISNSLDAFGDTPGTLAPGSAGEAGVARNLGLSVMGFQDRNRTNRETSLKTAEDVFPRRTFGLDGQTQLMLSMLNNQGTNNWNQADYANRFQTAQLNFNTGRQQAANNVQQGNAEAAAGAQADAQKKQAMIAGGAAIAGALIIF